MITHLSIRNLVIVESLEIPFEKGMTVFTGETGAGKSILIDALGLALGARAETGMIRQGAEFAEVTAVYDLSQIPLALTWLEDQGLIEYTKILPKNKNTQTQDPESTECIIRRQITEDGRSRAYINGRLTPLAQIRELAELLVALHGQHQHQRLLQTDHQRFILDEFADHKTLLTQIHSLYKELQNLNKEKELQEKNQNQSDKLALVQFQIQELEALNLEENEEENLSLEHRKLTHAENWLSTLSAILSSLENDSESSNLNESSSAETSLEFALNQISSLLKEIPQLQSCTELLKEALIQTREAKHELLSFKDSISVDPERLQKIDQRLSQIHTLARKYRLPPIDLSKHLQTLQTELKLLENSEAALVLINQKISETRLHYNKVAKVLTDSRKKTAALLEKEITERIHSLEMPQGIFKIQINPKSSTDPSPYGLDEIEFLVTTNPGQSPQALKKVASGGELSRISLSIQVIASQKLSQPTLIFDEVDVGISGKTAETVGSLLRELGRNTQILCVTHLAQVASKAHHHFKIEKTQTENKTTTEIKPLFQKEKIQEIARLIGGRTLTQTALDHAEELLKQSEPV